MSSVLVQEDSGHTGTFEAGVVALAIVGPGACIVTEVNPNGTATKVDPALFEQRTTVGCVVGPILFTEDGGHARTLEAGVVALAVVRPQACIVTEVNPNGTATKVDPALFEQRTTVGCVVGPILFTEDGGHARTLEAGVVALAVVRPQACVVTEVNPNGTATKVDPALFEQRTTVGCVVGPILFTEDGGHARTLEAGVVALAVVRPQACVVTEVNPNGTATKVDPALFEQRTTVGCVVGPILFTEDGGHARTLEAGVVALAVVRPQACVVTEVNLNGTATKVDPALFEQRTTVGCVVGPILFTEDGGHARTLEAGVVALAVVRPQACIVTEVNVNGTATKVDPALFEQRTAIAGVVGPALLR